MGRESSWSDLAPPSHHGPPRAHQAFILLGLNVLIEGGLATHEMIEHGHKLSSALIARVQPRLGTNWLWFEDWLSYDNARLPEALDSVRHGARMTPNLSILGCRTLGWLCEKQTSPNGVFPSLSPRRTLVASVMLKACSINSL